MFHFLIRTGELTVSSLNFEPKADAAGFPRLLSQTTLGQPPEIAAGDLPRRLHRYSLITVHFQPRYCQTMRFNADIFAHPRDRESRNFWCAQMFKLKLPPNCVLVAAEPGTVIGFVGAECFRRQQMAATARSKAAYHEAGHVLGCITLAIPIIKATLDPPGLHRGHFRPLPSEAGLEKLCIMSLCGGEAERLFFPGADGGDEIDLQMVREYLKPRGALRMLNEIDRYRGAARRLVSDHRQRIEVIAAELLRRGVLTDDEIDALVM